MRIVYRMRGLLGDATEEFVDTFASPTDSQEDNETTYKLANVLVRCGGLKVVLNVVENVMGQPLVTSRVKPVMAVVLKLLGYCTKVKMGRQALLDPELGLVATLLPVLQLCLEHELTSIQGSSGVVYLADQVLEVRPFWGFKVGGLRGWDLKTGFGVGVGMGFCRFPIVKLGQFLRFTFNRNFFTFSL